MDGETRSAEADAMGRISLATAVSMLDGLTTAQRDVVFLRVIAGLSVLETSEVMGRPPGAIKALQHRALTALRNYLTESSVTETSN